MNVKIGELVEYVEDLKRAHERKVKGLRDTTQILVDIKRENEKELDGRDQLIHQLTHQLTHQLEERDQLIHQLEEKVKAANEVALQAASDARKEIGERLKKEYGWGEEDLKIVGLK